MKIYITKYALSSGIIVREGELTGIGTMVSVRHTEVGGFTQYFHRPDWHMTKVAALKKAEKMREKKLQSLEKQIEKIKDLNFEEMARERDACQ